MYKSYATQLSLKNYVKNDFFSDYDCANLIGNTINFCIVKNDYNALGTTNTISYLWAGSKKGTILDINKPLVKLILTIGKTKIYQKNRPPYFIGFFDCEKIVFIPYYDIMPIFYQTDFNWNITIRNHNAKELKQLYDLIDSKKSLFKFKDNNKELREFIKLNFVINNTNKILINRNNFINIYLEWRELVLKTINTNAENIIEKELYLSDILSYNNTIAEIEYNLSILVQNKNFNLITQNTTKSLIIKLAFKDKQNAHRQFWNKYQKPEKKEFWDYIINKKDLLLPQDIRERKGAFFTPYIWVAKSQEYLYQVLGKNYQDRYYIWDCAAGTGNLLIGLTHAYNVFASTLDTTDVDTIKNLYGGKDKIPLNQIFQFDFLNDSLLDKKCNTCQEFNNACAICKESKLPKRLQDILKDSKKRQNLILYINPPYAEAGNTANKISKTKISNQTSIHKEICQNIGYAKRELFIQFLMRIYIQIPDCIIANFAKLKLLTAPYLKDFRDIFQAKLLKLFICPAYTFDNVKGNFPIGFFIWDTKTKKEFKTIKTDIYNKNGVLIQTKDIINQDKKPLLNEWIRAFQNDESNKIALLICNSNDFQTQNTIFIISKRLNKTSTYYKAITPKNLLISTIYFSVRHCIKATWINHNDQFLYPNNKWIEDSIFHSDCLAYTLFHTQNRISSQDGINHFIPFSEYEVNSKAAFKSHILYDFINGSIKDTDTVNTHNKKYHTISLIPKKPLVFSKEAKEVFYAGMQLYRYYHNQDFKHPLITYKDSSLNLYNPNASLYDIKAYFQKFNDRGKMNNKSKDIHYNNLLIDLRMKLEILAKRIETKVYEYEFLV